MEQDKSFEKLFDSYNFTERIDNSLRNYSNWLLGISLGLTTILISIITNSKDIRWYFILPTLIFNFIGIFYNGFIKHKIFRREIFMNIHIGELKKIVVKNKVNKSTIFNVEKEFKNWNDSYNNYLEEREKLSEIGKNLNYSSKLTFFSVIISGILIIYIILQ